MSTYIININEKTKKGRDLKKRLEKENLELLTLNEFDAMEEDAIAREIEKAKKTKSYTYKEAKSKLAQLRKELSS